VNYRWSVGVSFPHGRKTRPDSRHDDLGQSDGLLERAKITKAEANPGNQKTERTYESNRPRSPRSAMR